MSAGGGDARLRAGFAAAAEHAKPRADCPAPERLWDAAHGTGEVEALVLHTATCPACAEAWRLAVELSPEGRAAEVPAAPVSALDAARRRRRRVLWSAAGALAAAAVIVIVVLVRRPEGPSEYRGGDPAPLRSLLGPGAQVMARQHVVLRWDGGPPGATYDVRVLDAELRLLYEAKGLTEKVLGVPPPALDGVAPGGIVHWQVDARVGDQKLSSPTFQVRLP